MKKLQPGAAPVHQQGMVLLLCLIFMTALTLLGLTASADTLTQRQLAANLRDNERARQTAQLSLKWVENWLVGLTGSAPESCLENCTGLYVHPAGSLHNDLHSEPAVWWALQGYEVGFNPETGVQLASVGMPGIEPPLWMIQLIHQSPASPDGSTPPLDWYRILVRTTGQSANTVTVLESVVKKSWIETATSAEFTGRVSWQELR